MYSTYAVPLLEISETLLFLSWKFIEFLRWWIQKVLVAPVPLTFVFVEIVWNFVMCSKPKENQWILHAFYVLDVLLSGGKCLLDVVVEQCSLGLFSVRVTLSSLRIRLETSLVNLFRDVTVSSVSSSEPIRDELGRSLQSCDAFEFVKLHRTWQSRGCSRIDRNPLVFRDVLKPKENRWFFRVLDVLVAS